MGVVEWWRPFGALVTQDFYCMCYVYNSGEPGWYESGERETSSVCVGTREGRSGDCGRRARSWRCSPSRQGGNYNDNPIRKINNKTYYTPLGIVDYFNITTSRASTRRGWMLSKQYYVTLHHKIGRIIFVCCTVPGNCSFPFFVHVFGADKDAWGKKGWQGTYYLSKYLSINMARYL